MSRRPLACALLFALALLAAGCTAPAEDPATGTNVSVSVTNEHASAQEVRIAVVTGEYDGIDLTYRNGSTRRVVGSNVSAIPPAALANVTDFAVRGDDVQRRSYRLTPGSGTGATYGVDGPATVVYAYWPRGGERVTDYGQLGCGQSNAVLDARLVIGANGSDSATVTCRGG
ncbi:hypothetical protein [Halorientalis halophila]|uniref:hypothetical protein n=1 Tax=Halorientalis halophila TaxID=3108499 RepID=UPI00300817F1